MLLPSSLVISQGWGLIDLPLRATFSPTHPLARRDVPLAQARGVRGRALHEQKRSSASIPFSVVVFFAVDWTEAFFLEQRCGVGDHGAAPAEIDGQILDGGNPFFDQP